MFTCMASRAVNIEVTFSMDTDLFILALRRLIARHEDVRSIYSDNGSNFIVAERELRKAYEEMDEIGLSGIRILHLQITWKMYERGKFNQPEQYYHLY